MPTKPTIVIIGTGDLGKIFAACLADGNYPLLICDKDHEKAEVLATVLKIDYQSCNIEAMPCTFDSAWEADIIILTMHFRQQKEVVEIIKDVVNQKILVSLVRTGEQEMDGDTSYRHQSLQVLLPNTKIVTLVIQDPLTGKPSNVNCFTRILIVGNDEKANEIVCGIFEAAGVNAFAS